MTITAIILGILIGAILLITIFANLFVPKDVLRRWWNQEFGKIDKELDDSDENYLM